LSAGVRVSIWRPFAADRPLILQGRRSEYLTPIGPETQLLREVFSWQVREDIWAGVLDSDVRERLSQRLIEDFEPILPPNERGMPKLRLFVDELARTLPETDWSESAHQFEEDGQTPVRLNALWAFYTQLRWIYDVFRHVPEASVAIR